MNLWGLKQRLFLGILYMSWSSKSKIYGLDSASQQTTKQFAQAYFKKYFKAEFKVRNWYLMLESIIGMLGVHSHSHVFKKD